MLLILQLITTLSALNLASAGHKCIHDSMNHSTPNYSPTNELRIDERQSTEFNIRAYYSSAVDHSLVSKVIKSEIIPEAVQFWRKSLSSKFRLKDPIRIRPKCRNRRYYPVPDPVTGKPEHRCAQGCQSYCMDIQIPNEILDTCINGDKYGKRFESGQQGSGALADFVLLVDATNTPQCRNSPSTLAYATTCTRSSDTHAPRSGAFNFCPSSLKDLERNKPEVVNTAIHEIGHALGFSSLSFPHFLDEKGKPYDVLKDKEISTKTARGKYDDRTKVLFAPHTIGLARKYFGCDKIDYIPIENEGGSGTGGSHLEQRLFGPSLMTGATFGRAQISQFDLGIFQDSGWYDVKYPMKFNLTWAKNLGCGFYFDGCGDVVNEPTEYYPDDPFCAGEAGHLCLSYMPGYGVCNVGTFSAAPGAKVYLPKDPNTGGLRLGKSALCDRCPVIVPKSPGQYSKLSSFCDDENNKKAPLGQGELRQDYGPQSRCFAHKQGDPWKKVQGMYQYQSVNSNEASCHNIKCANGKLSVKLGDKFHDCPANGGEISFSEQIGDYDVTGTVVCPKASLYC